MSVAPLTTQELGLFVALQIKLKICPAEKFRECVNIAEQISIGNCKAWADSYADQIYPASFDDIEREALAYLGDKTGRMAREHFGPLAYNCVSQNGDSFFGFNESKPLITNALKLISSVEKRCSDWQDSERRRIETERENDAAYADVEPLPRKTMATVAALCRELGFNRVIVAEYRVDESDSMTDYFSHRTARSVIIGFGQGKRESFKQLREAAARFEPTRQYGPGCDVWTARVVFSHDHRGNGQWFSKGQSSPWHREFNDSDARFTTRAAAEQWAEQCGAPHDITDGDTVCKFEWELNCESVENRENYSMGGGNYLGSYRHNTGWKVRSWPIDATYYSQSTELAEVLPFDVKQFKRPKSAKRKAVEVELLDRSEHKSERSKQVFLKLRHGKTECLIGQSVGRKGGVSWTVSTGHSRYGKTFWYEETLRSWYKSTPMVAMISFALEHFAKPSTDAAMKPEEPAGQPSEPDEPTELNWSTEYKTDIARELQADPTSELQIDTSDIDATAWL